MNAIRRLLSKEENPPVKQVLDTGILAKLIELITSADPKIGFEAAWAVTNIASTEYTSVVVDAGAVRPLVAGMMSGDSNVRDQCVWCVGNIAGDSAKYRNMLLETEGALQALFLNIQNPSNLPLLRNATWALSNFCRGKPTPHPDAVKAILPALSFLLSHEDKDVVQEAAWGVSYLTESEEGPLQAVVDAGVVPRSVALMAHAEQNVVLPALRIVGNVISGSDRQTQAAVDAGAMPAIVPLLNHPKRNIRREACWAVSNIAAGTPTQIGQLVAVPGLLASVIHQLGKGEFAVRKEAAWVVSNIATTGTAEHVRILLENRAAEPMSDMVTIKDPRMQCVILDAIKAILVVGKRISVNGVNAYAELFENASLLDHLEDVQRNCHADVLDRAVAIIDDFFDRDEDSEEAGQALAALGSVAAPAVPPHGAFAGFGAALQPSNGGWSIGAPAAACQAIVPAPAGPFGFNFSHITFS